ncbi:MAG TPA: DNA polymerase III subunit beta [Elusimicrobiota bacterium]|nr:DNA polymerase III subunit beta [Elusimicrobiota bacterium]
MKIHCTKEELAQSVETIQSALSARTTLPILYNFLMETERSKIKFVSTDLEMGIKHYCKAEVEQEGSVTIPAKKFSDILRSLPDGQDVTLTVQEGSRILLKCGRSRFNILGAPKSEYPLLPEFNQKNAFDAPAAILKDMIQKTVFAASTDETRHALNGVFWRARKGLLEMVATDGRRLAFAAKPGIVPKETEFQVIVPAKALNELQKLLNTLGIESGSTEKIRVGVTENQIWFQIQETTILSRLVTGTFPQYENVIPSKKDVSIAVGAKDLIAVTKRAALCAVERGGSVKYAFKKGSLEISAASQNLEFFDEMPLEYAGGDIQVGFNSHFILEALKHIDSDRVAIGMTVPANPVLLEPEGGSDYRFVVMPMRA